jgi:hypothetical protein
MLKTTFERLTYQTLYPAILSLEHRAKRLSRRGVVERLENVTSSFEPHTAAFKSGPE